MRSKMVLYNRSVFCFFVLLALFFVCILRMLTLASDSGLAQTALQQSSKSIQVYKPRGTVYDTNGVHLTNAQSQLVAVFAPTPQGILSAAGMLSGETKENALYRLKCGDPVDVAVEQQTDLPGVTYVTVPVRYTATQTAAHVLGYLDASDHGAAGIERGLDELLYTPQGVQVCYTTDATGNVLEGVAPTIRNGGEVTDVVLTLDARIQQIAENSLKNTPKGAALVLEAGTGKIRAMASRPDLQPTRLEEYIHAPDAPFLNRTLNAYNVGSVFKLCIAAAALDTGLAANHSYTCTGSTVIGGRVFRCHASAGHQIQTLPGAIAYSCNTYFYHLGLQVGAASILRTAKNFAFGQVRDIGGGLVQQAGSLPELQDINSLPGAVANLSIGQGALTLSPLAMASLYEAVVCGGKYTLPTIIEGYQKSGAFTPAAGSVQAVGMRSATADTLKTYLQQALELGTGIDAKPQVGTAGGKTATAQTGRVVEGREVLHGWFCGFVTHGAKTYVIVVFAEDVSSGSASCAPVFKEIAERLAEI